MAIEMRKGFLAGRQGAWEREGTALLALLIRDGCGYYGKWYKFDSMNIGPYIKTLALNESW